MGQSQVLWDQSCSHSGWPWEEEQEIRPKVWEAGLKLIFQEFDGWSASGAGCSAPSGIQLYRGLPGWAHWGPACKNRVLPGNKPVLREGLCAQSFSCVWLFATPWTVACQAPLSMGASGKNTAVGCHFLLQGIVLTQGLNLYLLRLLHHRWILYSLSHRGRVRPINNNAWVIRELILRIVWGLFLRTGSCLALYSINIAAQSSTPGTQRLSAKRARGGVLLPLLEESFSAQMLPHKGGHSLALPQDSSPVAVSSPHRQQWRLMDFTLTITLAFHEAHMYVLAGFMDIPSNSYRNPCKGSIVDFTYRCRRMAYLLRRHSVHKGNVNPFLQLIWAS